MKVFFILILIVDINRAGTMTAVPGFSSREDCQSAGEAFKVEAKAEYYRRYYCVAAPERNGTR